MASTEELARLLAEQYARADVSLRELELRAKRAGGTRLARATCSDMLAGRRFPKKAVMVAFLQACQVPEEQLPGWERAWERVRISQISTTPVSGARRDEPVPPSPLGQARDESAPASQTPVMDHPVRGRRPTWRRIAVPAGLAATTGLVTVIGVATLADSDATARRVVIDDGRAFGSGGSSRFIVTVDPASTEVRLTRRLDAGIPKQTAMVTVDGAVAAVWQPLPAGPHGWRDQSVVLPATLTMGRRQLTITNTFVSSDLDFNEFIYFIDHKLDGVWSRADTLDVGPHHLDSEAAHHYRITNQTWADTNPFTYLG